MSLRVSESQRAGPAGFNRFNVLVSSTVQYYYEYEY